MLRLSRLLFEIELIFSPQQPNPYQEYAKAIEKHFSFVDDRPARRHGGRGGGGPQKQQGGACTNILEIIAEHAISLHV